MATQTRPSFVPKQCYPKTAELYNEVSGDSTTDVAASTIKNLLPPFTSSSVIHDNGCGTGAALSQVMTSNPPPGIKIIATDSSQYMVDACSAIVKEKSWPVETHVMRCEELTFPDNTFTTSFSNFFVAHTDDPLKAARHLFRTLVPGGTAVVSTWASLPHIAPLEAAHVATRGPDVLLPILMRKEWFRQDTLRTWLINGGFEDGKISIHTIEAWVETKDLRHWLTIAWSYLGERKGGWLPEDEENWERAVDLMVESMLKSTDFKMDDTGTVKLRLVANVALAVK